MQGLTVPATLVDETARVEKKLGERYWSIKYRSRSLGQGAC